MAIIDRKERDRQLRRADILKASEHLFALKGYHDATIRDIAREAQYATGTVYLHFKDKDALYFALLEEKVRSVLSIIEEKTGKTPDAGKKIEIFIRESLSFFESNQDFFQIFIAEQKVTTTERRIFKSPTGVRFHNFVAGLAKYAQEQGAINCDLKPEQVAGVLMAIIKAIGIEWVEEENRKNQKLVSLSGVVFKLFLCGAGCK